MSCPWLLVFHIEADPPSPAGEIVLWGKHGGQEWDMGDTLTEWLCGFDVGPEAQGEKTAYNMLDFTTQTVAHLLTEWQLHHGPMKLLPSGARHVRHVYQEYRYELACMGRTITLSAFDAVYDTPIEGFRGVTDE